jgi:hypothetical protein
VSVVVQHLSIQNVFIKPFLYQQMSQSAYSETPPKTPNSKLQHQQQHSNNKNTHRYAPDLHPVCITNHEAEGRVTAATVHLEELWGAGRI